MNIVDYLKSKRFQLLETRKRVEKVSTKPEEPHIEIVIENNSELFENEHDIILKGAKGFLDNGIVDSLEEGAITFATMIRGLRYLRTEIDEDGTIKIYLRDNALENNRPKTL